MKVCYTKQCVNTLLKITVEYIAQVERALLFIIESPAISKEEKRRFFKSAYTNFGMSALCLSGGATFGYCSFFLDDL